MRWDYLYYYYNEYGEGGLKRLLSEGYSCENCQINYAPAITALGHTSVFTGSVPSIHGIAGNWFYIDDKGTENCQDTTAYTIGGEKSRAGQRSPHLMRTSTIGDELRLSNDYQRAWWAWPSRTVPPSCPLAIRPMLPTGGTTPRAIS